jgi:thiol-disulfide isomerase/thioredoxin
MRTEATATLLTLIAVILPTISPAALLTADAPVQEQREPETMVVFIHSRNCNVCAKIRPILDDLEHEYGRKAHFLRLDVTDSKDKEISRKLAKEHQLGAFFAFYEDTYPCVGVFSKNGKCLKELYGFNAREKYVAQIEKALQAP